MMLCGDGVGSKYNVVIEARRRELVRGVVDPKERERRIDMLMEFRQQLQHGSLQDLNEWYDLYKDA